MIRFALLVHWTHGDRWVAPASLSYWTSERERASRFKTYRAAWDRAKATATSTARGHDTETYEIFSITDGRWLSLGILGQGGPKPDEYEARTPA